ncbi:MAG: AI-2E family transporter [Phycisphaerae bacterium]|nr:AI-2E family transporter [Phycisphaerae bacterium]MDW8261964.1 AI-2E family transporter [Phycisphaerales bacterium]
MRRLSGNWVALLVFTGIALYLSWLIIAPFINVIVWAGVLAVVSYPMYCRWRDRGRGPALSAAITTLFVVLVILIPLLIVGGMLVRQLPQAISSAQDGLQRLLDPESWLFRFAGNYVDLEQWTAQLRDREWVAERVKAFSAMVAAKTPGIVGGLLNAVVQIFFVLFTLYYLLKDADRIVPAIRDALPLEPEQADAVFVRAREIISASLHGVLVIAAIQGALGGIMFWLLGIPSAVLWGVVMFLLSMIPMAGAALVWLPAAVYLLASGHPVKAVVLGAWGAGVIGMIDNLLRPKLVGERTRLHELVVFFSVLGGLQVFGVLGLVVGPVVVAIGLSLLEVFRRVEWSTVETANPSK